MRLTKAIEPVLSKIIAHGFLTSLAAGALPKEIYHFYLVQDYYYLLEYRDALMRLANQAVCENESSFFRACAQACSTEPAFDIHNDIHDKKIPLTKACEDYITFLKKHTNADYENFFVMN